MSLLFTQIILANETKKKQLCKKQSLKSQAKTLKIYDSSINVIKEITLRHGCSEHLLLRTPLEGCFCKILLPRLITMSENSDKLCVTSSINICLVTCSQLI